MIKQRYVALKVHIFAFLVLPFYWLSLLFPKSHNIVVISEWGGNVRGDNAANLFAALREEYPSALIKLVGGTQNARFADSIIPKYSFSSIWAHLRAGVFVVGSGKSDCIRCLITRRSILINVWHGLPVKKISYLNGHQKKHPILYHLRDVFLPMLDERPNYILSSERHSDIMREAFEPREGVIIAPQPRWLGLASNSDTRPRRLRRVLYAPTFRDDDLLYFPLSNKELRYLDRYIDSVGGGLEIYISIHPACQFTLLGKFANIKSYSIQTEGGLYDYFLPRVDALITDISGLIFDFEFMKKPYFIFFPDRLEYQESSREIIEEMNDLIGSKQQSDFVSIVKTLLSYDFASPNQLQLDRAQYIREFLAQTRWKLEKA